MNNLYDILRTKFLIDDDAIRHWRFILFLIFLAIMMIANTHSFEQKLFRIADLTIENRELRSKFADTRTELMRLKMESTVAKKMSKIGVYPPKAPPVKIKVVDPNISQKRSFKNLWGMTDKNKN